MSHPHTDEFGMPLRAITALRLENGGKKRGRWSAPPVRRAYHCGEPLGALTEDDQGFMGAIRLGPRLVGTQPGQVPPSTAARFVAAGCVVLV